MTNVKTITGALLAFSITFSGVALAKSNKVIATVGKTKITEQMYRDALERLGPQAAMITSDKSMRIQLLDQLVNLQAFSDAAKAKKYDQKKDFKDKVEQFKKETLANMLLKESIETELSDKNLKAYFDKNKDKYSSDQIRASHILFNEDDKEKAEKILKEALAGKDFAELAKTNSIGPSAKSGGDLNFFGKGQMVKEFEEAAFKTEKGKVNPSLIKTRFGYHIIKVTDIKDGKNTKFEDKKAEVTRDYRNDARDEVIAKIKKQAKVTIDKKALEAMELK